MCCCFLLGACQSICMVCAWVSCYATSEKSLLAISSRSIRIGPVLIH
uniref:Uncharacterized protein n=1 Tax=Setaria viridis TaxID=4556 RepID=A0A4U6SU12_SETVI|nr:hypothetical protein SEVIR_9G152332v2 [Setaria viridis]